MSGHSHFYNQQRWAIHLVRDASIGEETSDLHPNRDTLLKRESSPILLNFEKFKDKTTVKKRGGIVESSPYEEYGGGGGGNTSKIKQWSTQTTQLHSAYRMHRVDSENSIKL